MTEPYLAQITLFGGNFAIRGWAYCSGQLLPISSNSALFSLLGTTYGGDGRTTFALPDLRGRSPRGSEGNAAGPGLAPVRLGEKAGAVSHVLTVGQLPNHNHPLLNNAKQDAANQNDPQNNFLAAEMNFHTGPADVSTGPTTTGNQGGNQSFNILNPYLGLNYLIATQGIFPSRN